MWDFDVVIVLVTILNSLLVLVLIFIILLLDIYCHTFTFLGKGLIQTNYIDKRQASFQICLQRSHVFFISTFAATLVTPQEGVN